MKDNQFNAQDQVSDQTEYSYLHGANGVSASAPLSPPRGVGDRDDSLLYLSCSNSDKVINPKKGKRRKKVFKKGQRGWKGDDWTPNSKEYKIMKSLRTNIEHWEKIYGVERLFMNTLTFKDNLTDPKEAQRRFNNYNRQFSRIEGITWLYKGIEPQKRGALHFHIIGVAEYDLGSKTFDWESLKRAGEAFDKGNKALGYKYTRKYSATANDKLKELWKITARIAKGSKMGRSEFLPVRSAKSIGQYVGKYLGKCFASQNNGTWCEGLRRYSYARKAPQVHGRQFSWVKGTHGTDMVATWRQKVGAWAKARGVRNLDDMRRKYGKKWSIHNMEEINTLGMLWHMDPKFKDKPFGWCAPARYPEGIDSPLNNMWQNERWIKDPFETSEDELWEDWLKSSNTRGSLNGHARNLEKWQKAEKHKAFLEKVYG
jgi:hypothetical protein